MSDIQSLINQAWVSAFQENTPNGPNPYFIPGILDNATNRKLNDLHGLPDTGGKIDLCTVAFDPNPPVAKGKASFSCTAMTLTGFLAGTPGTPNYLSDGTSVDLPIDAASLKIAGSFDIVQTCCTSVGWDCINDFDSHLTGTFTLTLAKAVATLSCTIAPPELVLNKVSMSSTGTSATASASKAIDWMDYFVHALSAFGPSVQQQVQQLISSQQLMTQMQNALQELMGKSGHPATAV